MTKTVKIEGMMCPHCEAHVKKALEALPGVAKADVSHTAGTAVLDCGDAPDAFAVRQAVEDAGYRFLAMD